MSNGTGIGNSKRSPALIRFHVKGLLGHFDHDIHFPADWTFCILHGPNGVGKTKVLELIKSLLALEHDQLLDIPFSSARAYFEDGSQLFVTMSRTTLELDIPDFEETPGTNYLEFSYEAPGNDPITWQYPDSDSVRLNTDELSDLVAMAKRTPPGSRIPYDRLFEIAEDFISQRGSTLRPQSIDERRFQNILRSRFDRIYPGRGHWGHIPEPVKTLRKRNSVEFIATQRLLMEEAKQEHSHSGQEGGKSQRSAVAELARDLSNRLQRAMAENSQVSQKLDRNFPASLLQGHLDHLQNATESEIRERYADQSELRKQLGDIAVLDAAPDIPLPKRKLQPWERMVLSKYLDDTEKKLSTYKTLLSQVTLLRDIINSRFLLKSMHVDREQGFLFKSESGKRVLAHQLSSGEQHELVMMYTMLFKVRAGSLVLIDEPEISLHIAWQQQFINDMVNIAKVSGIRFIVATHSPQLIHHWWDNTISLGPVEMGNYE